MTDKPPLSASDIEAIRQAVDRVNVRAWGLSFGLCAGTGLFLATAILLLRGDPDPGPHLGLLGAYFPGYRVTWPGAFVGFAYGALLGFLVGSSIGAIYNRLVVRL